MSKSKKLTATELKKCLRDVSWNQLETIICNLYRNSDQANLYFNAVFHAKESREEILDDYEKKLARCFNFHNPHCPDMKTGKAVIKEAQKLTDPQTTLHIMLRFVEMGTEFTNTYGDIDSPFYDTLISAFDQFVHILNTFDDNTLYEEFADRIDHVIRECAGIGWGYGDEMGMLHEEIIWIEED